MIIKCKCKHAFQDKKYGQGFRVGNMSTKSHATCTVCNAQVKAK